MIAEKEQEDRKDRPRASQDAVGLQPLHPQSDKGERFFLERPRVPHSRMAEA